MAADLSFPVAFEHNGLLYLMGYRQGRQYIRRSADMGRTWLGFPDQSIERSVGDSSDPQRGALVKMQTGGAMLVAGIPRWPSIEIYVSADDGMTWVHHSSV